jgi:hypothetical protein
MNYHLFTSAVLVAITSLLHSLIGEVKIIGPIQKSSDLPAVRGSIRHTKLTLRFTWHVTTVLGFGFAVILFHLSTRELTADHIFIVRAISLTFLVNFFVSLIGSRARHISWVAFLVITVLTWWGTML